MPPAKDAILVGLGDSRVPCMKAVGRDVGFKNADGGGQGAV